MSPNYHLQFSVASPAQPNFTKTAKMTPCKTLVIVFALVMIVVQPHGCAGNGNADINSSASSCPAGKVCPREKCLLKADGSEKCCSCTTWGPNGMCTPSGWKGANERGACKLGSHPNTDINMTNCPAGKVCQLSKCKGAGEMQTCCSCMVWNDDGTCREDSWSRVRGNGDCSVVPGDGSSYITGLNVGQEAPTENRRDLVETPQTPVVNAEVGSTENTEQKETEEFSAQSAFIGTPVEPTEKEVKLHGPPNTSTAPMDPLKDEEHPEFIVSHCPVGKACQQQKCRGDGGARTCCDCKSWNSEGKCLPGEWKVLSGEGTCDFIIAEDSPAIAVPTTGAASTEQYDDALPFTPCPAGITCETTKCAITDGVERCCDCFVWKPIGLCADNGWKPRGHGDCVFASRDSIGA